VSDAIGAVVTPWTTGCDCRRRKECARAMMQLAAGGGAYIKNMDNRQARCSFIDGPKVRHRALLQEAAASFRLSRRCGGPRGTTLG
jgi:hypothetical protein